MSIIKPPASNLPRRQTGIQPRGQFLHNIFTKTVLLWATVLVGTAALGACTFTDQTPSADNSQPDDREASEAAPTAEMPVAEEAFRFVIVSDSHSDNETLGKLLEQASADQPAFVLHLGDLTRVGGLDELKAAKQTLDQSGFTCYAIPGDHDIVRAGGTEYFESVFGRPFQSFDYGTWRVLLIDNSDIEDSLTQNQWNWLETLADDSRPTIAVMHNPPQHPLLKMATMEETEAGEANALRLLELFTRAGVRQVFAGDMHLFQNYRLDNDIPIVIAGAAGTPTNPAEPQSVLVLVYTDGTIAAEPHLLK